MTSEFAIAVHALVYLNHKQETLASEELAKNVCTNPARIRKVMAKLKKKNVSVIKRSELFQMCRGKFFKKTEEIFPTLELLESHGYLRLEEPERQSVGRPADVRIFVNPAAA